MKFTKPPLTLRQQSVKWQLRGLRILSKVFANLRDASRRKAVAASFGVDEQVLQTWLYCLSYLRNACAHHRRLWNLQMVIKPVIANKLKPLVPVKDRFYALAVILHY